MDALGLSKLLPFIGFAIITSVTPGPNNMMMLHSGARFGMARSLPHSLGISAGFWVQVFLVGVGLGSLWKAYPQIHPWLHGVCALYMIWLAIKIAKSGPLPAQDVVDASQDTAQPMGFMAAALFQWVNPKAIAMALSAVAVYLPAGYSWWTLAFFCTVYAIINWPCVLVWAWAGRQLRSLLQQPRPALIFNVLMALSLLVFVGLSVRQ